MSSQRSEFTSGSISALFDFSFHRFVTLSVMKALYALGMVLITFGWFAVVITAFTQGALEGLGMLVLGTLLALLYLVLYRVTLELIVVIFRIGENTTRLVEGADAEGDAPTAEA